MSTQYRVGQRHHSQTAGANGHTAGDGYERSAGGAQTFAATDSSNSKAISRV